MQHIDYDPSMTATDHFVDLVCAARRVREETSVVAPSGGVVVAILSSPGNPEFNNPSQAAVRLHSAAILTRTPDERAALKGRFKLLKEQDPTTADVVYGALVRARGMGVNGYKKSLEQRPK